MIIAQLYVEGMLGAGAMLSGLLVSAGVGLLVLVRANRHWKQNLAIIAVLYAIGVVWGLICERAWNRVLVRSNLFTNKLLPRRCAVFMYSIFAFKTHDATKRSAPCTFQANMKHLKTVR